LNRSLNRFTPGFGIPQERADVLAIASSTMSMQMINL
jgi:hypothetical protein